MGERTSYEPGTFCWVDLATTDQDAAKAFYAELFGWEYDDRPVGDGAVYSLATVGGRQVAAISTMPERMRQAGAPPSWMSYVSVADADATAARARELGAELVVEPFDVLDAGRMAVVRDPQGAVFALWQPREQRGAQLVNVAGAFTWNDVVTTDPEAARRFYADLFGWSYQQIEGAEPPYAVIRHRDPPTAASSAPCPVSRQPGPRTSAPTISRPPSPASRPRVGRRCSGRCACRPGPSPSCVTRRGRSSAFSRGRSTTDQAITAGASTTEQPSIRGPFDD
jgi:predicted enzyme related to lactoylglutathione lyase